MCGFSHRGNPSSCCVGRCDFGRHIATSSRADSLTRHWGNLCAGNLRSVEKLRNPSGERLEVHALQIRQEDHSKSPARAAGHECSSPLHVTAVRNAILFSVNPPAEAVWVGLVTHPRRRPHLAEGGRRQQARLFESLLPFHEIHDRSHETTSRVGDTGIRAISDLQFSIPPYVTVGTIPHAMPTPIHPGRVHAQWFEDVPRHESAIFVARNAFDDQPEQEVVCVAVLPACTRREIQRAACHPLQDLGGE